MLKKLMELEGRDREYVSLDDLNDRALAKADPALFFQLHKPPILIDEIQYAPELFTYIKIIIDKSQRPGDFWLTGSQIFKLMSGVRESLAGRVALLHLSPLSQQEIYSGFKGEFLLDFQTLIKRQEKVKPADAAEIYKRIFNGSMPGLISGRYEDRSIFYSSYLSTYLERDVRDLSGSIDSLKFIRFMTAAAARTSQMLNYKAIADDCDIDQTTAKNWVNILETLGIMFLLHP
jgi:predicted AAA+ superfamily ATPase